MLGDIGHDHGAAAIHFVEGHPGVVSLFGDFLQSMSRLKNLCDDDLRVLDTVVITTATRCSYCILSTSLFALQAILWLKVLQSWMTAVNLHDHFVVLHPRHVIVNRLVASSLIQ